MKHEPPKLFLVCSARPAVPRVFARANAVRPEATPRPHRALPGAVDLAKERGLLLRLRTALNATPDACAG
jgi:hypothetical protein